jgi:hypothetical protein
MAIEGPRTLGELIVMMLGIAVAIFAWPILALIAVAVMVYAVADMAVRRIRRWF